MIATPCDCNDCKNPDDYEYWSFDKIRHSSQAWNEILEYGHIYS